MKIAFLERGLSTPSLPSRRSSAWWSRDFSKRILDTRSVTIPETALATHIARSDGFLTYCNKIFDATGNDDVGHFFLGSNISMEIGLHPFEPLLDATVNFAPSFFHITLDWLKAH